MDINTQIYLISRLDNIIEYCNSIKNVIQNDKNINVMYLEEKIDSISENIDLLNEIAQIIEK
jgi:hypothetical protein